MRRVKKKIYCFRFGTFIGRFPSEGAASIAVKGLKAGPVKSFLPQHLEPLAPDSPGVIRWSSWPPWSCKDVRRPFDGEDDRPQFRVNGVVSDVVWGHRVFVGG